VLNNGDDAQSYLALEELNGNVELQISTVADQVSYEQKIVLNDVSLDSLYGSDASTASQADLLQKMIDDSNLNLPTS
ncbi:type I secretion C-terminal target domain-containing protein, partial [Vibrio sp. FNV 38]|nr:type I secretion C-terminal target domain-containing protein [Vibrio sp. FNV 38]